MGGRAKRPLAKRVAPPAAIEPRTSLAVASMPPKSSSASPALWLALVVGVEGREEANAHDFELRTEKMAVGRQPQSRLPAAAPAPATDSIVPGRRLPWPASRLSCGASGRMAASVARGRWLRRLDGGSSSMTWPPPTVRC